MEIRHATQALQEILSDLPPEDHALKLLLFTERIEALEATESGHMGSNGQKGWEGIGGYEAGRASSRPKGRHGKIGKSNRQTAPATKGPSLAPSLTLVVLVLIEAIIIVVLVISRGGMPTELNNADNSFLETNSQYAESVENENRTASVFVLENNSISVDNSEAFGNLDQESNPDFATDAEEAPTPESNSNIDDESRVQITGGEI